MSYSISYNNFNFIVWTSVIDNKLLLKSTELSTGNMFLNVLDFLKEKKMQSIFLFFLNLDENSLYLFYLGYTSSAGASACSQCSAGFQCLDPKSPVACTSGYYSLSGKVSGSLSCLLNFQMKNMSRIYMYLYCYKVFWCCFEQLQ